MLATRDTIVYKYYTYYQILELYFFSFYLCVIPYRFCEEECKVLQEDCTSDYVRAAIKAIISEPISLVEEI